MSALNTNFDNDPFPVFTPRNIQPQIGRSPQTSNQVNNLIGQQQQQQQLQNQLGLFRSPSNQLTSSSSSSGGGGNASSQSNLRNQFATPNDVNLNRQLMNMVQNFSLNPQQQGNGSSMSNNNSNKMHLTGNSSRTPPPPSSSTHHQLQQQQQHHHQTPMIQQQSSVNGLQHMPMSAPTTNSGHHHHHHAASSSSAHRKLFTNLNNNSQLNDIMLLSGAQLDNLNLGSQSQSGNGGNGGGQLQQHQVGPINPTVPQFLPPDMEPSRTAPPDLSNVIHLKRSEAFFMNEELRSEILRKNLVTNSIPVQELAMQLPGQVKDYHNLVPLDSQQINIEHKSRTYGLQTISYKANHIKTNSVYYLKRILNFRYINQRCAEIVEAWKKIQHANICTLRDVFGTKEFNGEHSIVFVYDYHPGLETLQYRLYNNPNINLKGWANPYNLDGAARPFSAGKTLNGSRSLGLLPEHTVWDFVIQLSSIIRTIHSANLACRIITPSRLLLDHKTRLRLSGVGIFDVIDFDNNSLNPATLAEHQQEDLVQFGRLILALACNSLIAISKEHINTSIEIMNRTYSVDMRNVISYFMQPGLNASNGRVKQITDAIPFIGHRFYTSLDNAYTRGDVMENELSKEIENGRLFRLICKLNIVLDRQDDVQWGETGDRYMLKLFRDYVFHQVTPNGQPWIDLSHMISCLNKFDSGSSEKICLVSPDSQNIMIVSYAQLKKCFEKVFNEITANMNT